MEDRDPEKLPEPALTASEYVHSTPAIPASERLSPMARRILAYLRAHPHARDSLEGIAEWWLLEQKIRETTEDVSKALSELTSKGLIVEQERLNIKVFGLAPL